MTRATRWPRTARSPRWSSSATTAGPANESGQTPDGDRVSQGANGTVTFTAGDVTLHPERQLLRLRQFTYTSATTARPTGRDRVVRHGHRDDHGHRGQRRAGRQRRHGDGRRGRLGHRSTSWPTTTTAADVGRDPDGHRGDPGHQRHGDLHRDRRQLHAGRRLQRLRQFTYTISDGNGGVGHGHRHVTVTEVNDAPIADDDSDTVAEDGSVTTLVVVGQRQHGPANETVRR